ncbi:MAG: hypothetical protein IJ341_07635 [Bacteroidales bacterium]|nr:hypothetical protein [Bacteroidales bacterium]
MSKTLIVLGNGFDLDLGWKTSYSDFYKAKQKYFNYIYKLLYVEDMIKGEHWYNLEGYIRQCILSLSKDKIKILNDFWQVCRNYLYDYLAQPTNQQQIYVTNKNSCAYSLLKTISHSSIVSFNYTNPFYKNEIAEHEILYVHGRLENGAYKIKLGVDTAVSDECKWTKDESIKCIVKTNENDNINKMHTMLKNSENIIIYGHSLGITDSDYFEPFFKGIIENRVVNKNIYIVTYNETSLQCIKDNMLEYGISYSDLLLSNVNIQTIFTSKGKDDLDFCNMIKDIQF